LQPGFQFKGIAGVRIGFKMVYEIPVASVKGQVSTQINKWDIAVNSDLLDLKAYALVFNPDT